MLEQAASFLEKHKIVPSTAEQLAIKEHNIVVEARREVERKTQEDQVWDLTDPSLAGDDNKLTKKDLGVYEPEKTYEIRRRDQNGNVYIEKVSESEYREILSRQANDEPVMDMNIGLEGAVAENPRAKLRDVREEIQDRQRDERRQKFAELLSEGGDTIRWRVWDDLHPITWDDFQSADPASEKKHIGSYISMDIDSSFNGEDYTFFAYMVPEKSWCAPGLRSPASLDYMRLHMAITEMFARRIRARVANEPQTHNNFHGFVRKILSEEFAEMSAARSGYSRETQKGSDREAFSRWKAKIHEALDELKIWTHDPNPKRLALLKHDVGYFLLGQSYDFGAPHFEKSSRLAKKWYRLGVNKEHRASMNNLGALLMREAEGDFAEQKKAFKLFRRAAEKELPSAQFNLGVAYWRGLGVEADRQKAMDWFTRSADNIAYARYALKIMEDEDKKAK